MRRSMAATACAQPPPEGSPVRRGASAVERAVHQRLSGALYRLQRFESGEFAVTPLGQIKVAVYAKGATTAPRIALDLFTNDASNPPEFFAAGLTQQTSGFQALTTGFVKYEFTFTVPDGDTRAKVFLVLDNPTTTAVAYLDNATVTVVNGPPSRWQGTQFFTDYFNGAPTVGDIIAVNSGTSAATAATSTMTNNHPGVVQATTGTTATGRTFVGSNVNSIAIGGGQIEYEACVRIPTLSDATNRYALLFGLFDTNSAANQTDGCYILYDEGGVSTGSTAAAYWQTVTAANTARTFNTALTQITVAINTWYKLRIVVNPAGTEVRFYINDVQVAAHAANIPAGTARLVGFGHLLIKSIGTTARTALIDFLSFNQTFTTPR